MQIGFPAMKSLRDEFPGCAIGQHRHCGQLLIGRMRFAYGCGLGGKLSRMHMGRNRSSFWCDNRLGFRWRNEAEVFRSELIPSKDISQGRSGFSVEGSIIPRIFMSTLIKEQYFRKSRPRFAGNWPGGELLTVQENLKAKLNRSSSRLRTGRRFGRFNRLLFLDRRSNRAQFRQSRYLQHLVDTDLICLQSVERFELGNRHAKFSRDENKRIAMFHLVESGPNLGWRRRGDSRRR